MCFPAPAASFQLHTFFFFVFTGCLSLWNRTTDKCLTYGDVLFVAQCGVMGHFAVPCSAQLVELLALLGWK